MKVLYYFRNDYRLQDNPLLLEACDQAEEITFVAKAPVKSWGKERQKFTWECLLHLKRELREEGLDLEVLETPLKEVDLEVYDILYSPLINASHETQEIKDISDKIEVRSFWTDRLLRDLPYPVNKLPDVFTEFRKKIEKGYSPNSPLGAPSKWPKPIATGLQTIMPPSFEGPHKKSVFPFEGGESNALKRLQQYTFDTDLVATYKKTRNGLIGHEYSTKFSPYLATGCLSPHRIFYHVELYESEVKRNQDTYWVKFELWWREYFRWVYEKYGTKLFLRKGLKDKEIPYNLDSKKFQMWLEGQTGDDFVDANMKELKETGFMSNRGRQNVASYLVKDLNLPWKWGADYFEKVLIDYDVFSNWGNWQYVAGVGNDPRPNRYFNTQKQASMYDPDAKYRTLWNV